jgi:DUF971 family protein|tara:strand:- start:1198 stop:1515 length:318 start_codon:yes stop_codon:yes gene_type:complete
MKTTPEKVELLKDGVEIVWKNGGRMLYPYKYLRLQCSCAGCVEEMTGKALLNVSSIPDDIIIADYLEIGKYALQFLWTDGHQTGIYPYEYLLKLGNSDKQVQHSS